VRKRIISHRGAELTERGKIVCKKIKSANALLCEPCVSSELRRAGVRKDISHRGAERTEKIIFIGIEKAKGPGFSLCEPCGL
jgi:hypothetical protein